MKGDPIERLKKIAADAAASYVAVHCGDVVAAYDRCRHLDEIVAALWKGSNGQKPHQVVAIKKGDLEHLLALVERSNGPTPARSNVPGAEVQGERVADHHLPPGGQQRGNLGNAGPNDAPTDNA